MTEHELTPDTQAILLLCGAFGGRETSVAPLSAMEYHKLALWLHAQQMRPGDLLRPDGVSRIQTTPGAPVSPERLLALLARGGALALALESWSNKGLWVISRSDPDYPQRFRARLGRLAPPLLYGAGNRCLLENGGLAIVGSRSSTEAALVFTRDIARRCARQGMQVISGAARGVDSEAMQAALAADGAVVGVLADSLLRASVSGKYRQALRNGNLALVTAYDPEAGFTVGNAMGRNKYIYALSDYALVVSASSGEGGAWSGAVENLRKRWVPLVVWLSKEAPPANQRLHEMGALPLNEELLARHVALHDLFNELAGLPVPTLLSQEDEATADHVDAIAPEKGIGRDSADERSVRDTSSPSNQATLELMPADMNGAASAIDLFPIVWPHLEQALRTAQTERELAQSCGIELQQARAWLQRAVHEGLAVKLTRPTRYIIASQRTRK
ncbi:MAG: DNA-processing protein DprA [Roseiflexus sp.]|nr:DNA-processing protein DprA [Roseiflexus sp.]MCS7289993.1 DNA-processing protein DprA [Roseiflexus sp.]MDW8148832.1 DNA-processing protein DprA [Roseiflexaceae bacterium]MDW8233462.1 DNA-processing protein DprA [Roseiflexaceae bacterium]